MKTFTFDINSWHYKLASSFGYDPDFKKNDICAYLRKVALGMIITPVIATCIGIIGWLLLTMMVQMVLGPWFYFMYGLPLEDDVITSWVIVAFSLIIVGTPILYTVWRTKREIARQNASRSDTINHKKKPDSFLILAYRSYKDKFCAKLAFTENGQPFETEHQRCDREDAEYKAAIRAFQMGTSIHKPKS